jgi:excisionase family DNA binding protein
MSEIVTEPETGDVESPWLTRAEAATRARVNARTIDRWADEGRLTRHKADGLQSVRFRREELDALFTPEVPEPETDPFAD